MVDAARFSLGVGGCFTCKRYGWFARHLNSSNRGRHDIEARGMKSKGLNFNTISTLLLKA
jgi:hypothetical protein